MTSKGKQRTSAVEAPVLAPEGNPLWENNEIQFARLLMEVCANVLMTDNEIKDMKASMDIEDKDFDELWERAHDVWEAAKERTR
jgi:hypothetical protein